MANYDISKLMDLAVSSIYHMMSLWHVLSEP